MCVTSSLIATIYFWLIKANVTLFCVFVNLQVRIFDFLCAEYSLHMPSVWIQERNSGGTDLPSANILRNWITCAVKKVPLILFRLGAITDIYSFLKRQTTHIRAWRSISFSPLCTNGRKTNRSHHTIGHMTLISHWRLMACISFLFVMFLIYVGGK